MRRIRESILDFYLQWSLLADTVIAIVVWLFAKYCPIFEFKLEDKSSQVALMSDLIDCSVSLAGFILAALTIIVTFKSNIKAKGLEDANNAMEMILSSHHYHNIVRVFKTAIVEFSVCFLLLASFWAASDNLSIWTINRINVSVILSIALCLSRSFLILFSIIEMEKHEYD